jgi:WD40 repeat protein
VLAASSILADPPILWDLSTETPRQLRLPDNDLLYRALILGYGPTTATSLDGKTSAVESNGVAGMALDDEPGPLAFSPANDLLADGDFAGAGIRIRDLGTGRTIATLDQLEKLTAVPGDSAISALAFSPDGSLFTAATIAGAAVVWDTTTWEPTGPPLSEGGGAIHSLAFSPDGELLVTAGARDEIIIRDGHSGQPTGRVLVDSGKSDLRLGFQPLGFSADGHYLLRAGISAPVLFDMEVDKPVGGAFPGEAGYESAVPVGAELIATAVADHILVWNLDVEQWPAIACSFAGRNLTPDEWLQLGPSNEPYRPTCPQWPSLQPDEEGT